MIPVSIALLWVDKKRGDDRVETAASAKGAR
jgi:hypothetical protein